MKKILSLLILFSCRHICADAYENLKAAQAQFHRLIYQGGALPGVAGSAPEVAYISGFFYPPITLPADQESTEIYWALINKGMNKDPGHGGVAADGSNLQQFNALNLEALRQYNEYASNSRPRVSLTGHSVLGIAAQHPRVVITAPPPPAAAAAVASSSVVGSRSSSSTAVAAPKMGIAAGGFPFARPAQKAAVPDAKVPSLEAVKAKFREINDKPRKFKNDEADIQILKELEAELSGSGKAGDVAQQERFEKLVIAFNYINKQEEGDHLTALRKELVPGIYAVAVVAAPKAAPPAPVKVVKPSSMMDEMKLVQERRKSQPNADALTAAAIAAVDQSRVVKENPVETAIELCVSGSAYGVPSVISNNKIAVETAIERLKDLGDSATVKQKHILKVLERRLPNITEEDESGDDSDDEFGVEVKNSSGSLAASTPVKSGSSPKPAKNYGPSSFQRFSPKPSVVNGGGGNVKKAVAPAAVSAPPPPSSGIPGAQEKTQAAQPPQSPPPQPPVAVAAGDGALPSIDVWAEQEFERRKAEIERQINELNSEDTSTLGVMQRRTRGQEITKQLKPLEADFARYNNSYAKGSIIAEIKRGYLR